MYRKTDRKKVRNISIKTSRKIAKVVYRNISNEIARNDDMKFIKK